MQGFGLDRDGFLLCNPDEMPLKRLQGNAAEIKALAAAEDRGQHPLRVCGGEHKHHLRRRFLEGFEKGVERSRGEHVAFIHHVHLPARLHWCKAGAFDQIADVVHAGVRRRIDLDHIEGRAGGNRGAELAMAAGFRGGSLTVEAVEGASQDAGAGGFAGAPGAAEEIGRGDAARAQGVAKGRGNRLLPHQLIETLGPVFVMQWLVSLTHAQPAGC